MYLGIDIGGTKCALVLGKKDGTIVRKVKFETKDVTTTLNQIIESAVGLCQASPEAVESIGVSCGGPLDSRKGVILSPPNLPGWDHIEINRLLREATGIPAYLCNDANACALAEWKMGAGAGCENMIFLTFGTGMGAGLILNGRLYEGISDSAGECGHMRLAQWGPCGYGKQGSFEGFCSGGGIAQLAQTLVREQLQQGRKPALCPTVEELSTLTAAKVNQFAKAGDPLARKILEEVGTMLGVGLSILIDLFNPERIVIGSVFARAQEFLWPAAKKVIDRETLPQAREVCQVVPAGLTESVGDIAALTVASYRYAMDQK